MVKTNEDKMDNSLTIAKAPRRVRKGYLLLAALSGFFSVALGAFGSHGLKNIVSAELVEIFNVAVTYQFYHTFALIAVALSGHWIASRAIDWAAYCYMAGTALFSGSLYLYVFTGQKWLGPITPMGGGLLMLGWLLFAVAIWRNKAVELD